MDRRVDDRVPSCQPVGWQGPEGKKASRLRDISPTGCRLAEGSAGLSVGMPVTIELVENISVDGKVRWIEGDEAGIEFTIRIHETMVQALLVGADNVCFFASRRDMHLHDRFGRSLPRLGGGRSDRGLCTGSRE